MELTEEAIASLKQKHGESLVAAKTPTGEQMVFKKPSKEVWARFQDGLSRDKVSRSVALRCLALDCVVVPSQQEAAALFDAFPGMPGVLSNSIAELAGQSEDLDVKKL